MSIPLYPNAYEKLVREDINWLKKNTEHSLEQMHIIAILEGAIKRYDEVAYQKAMHENNA